MTDKEKLAENAELRLGVSRNEGESTDDYLDRVYDMMERSMRENPITSFMYQMSQWDRP